MKNDNVYGLFSDFDIEQHKATFVHYLEVLIKEDGTVIYAVPSHQEKAIALACEKLGVSRTELNDMCPREYYCDFMNWLLKISGAIAVWEDFCIAPKVSKKQIGTLKRLKMHGLYKGAIPLRSEQ